jgi:hypothetical protein
MTFKKKRIFWLGMHKILVRTELNRLRMLGYEVFNPPYLSHIPDQSAEMNWDEKQESTLPPSIFSKLKSYNFFYNSIAPEIAQILNEYFDAVLVTIHPDWLNEVLKVFQGKIIFRSYGQIATLSESLFHNGGYKIIANHSDFHFMPHAPEVVESEELWLKELAKPVPYCLTEDIFKYKNTFASKPSNSSTIAVSCPNIDSNHYYHHYLFIKKNLPPHYLMYGAQLRKVHDDQVIGTIPREDLISRFQNSAAYLYFYQEPRVCYLPPIEFMILGGPVIFLKGSLLDRYFGNTPTPARAQNIQEAVDICEKIRSGDNELVQKIVSLQDSIWKRYDPDFVWPKFDAAIHEAMAAEKKNLSSPFISSFKSLNEQQKAKKRIFIFHHFPGDCVHGDSGRYFSNDGIPRVTRKMVKALTPPPPEVERSSERD